MLQNPPFFQTAHEGEDQPAVLAAIVNLTA